MTDENIAHPSPIVTRAAARALGLKRYFTGKPCAHGHFSERYVSTCGCVLCCGSNYDAWRAFNPEKMKKATDAWRAANQDRRAQTWVNYYVRNAAWLRAAARLYYCANRDRCIAAHGSWRAKNSGHIRAYKVAHRAESAAYARNRRSRLRGTGGSHVLADVARIREQQGDLCAVCGTALSGGGHVDHVVPVARNGSGWPSNLQILCVRDNLRKSAKDPVDFAKEIGREDLMLKYMLM